MTTTTRRRRGCEGVAAFKLARRALVRSFIFDARPASTDQVRFRPSSLDLRPLAVHLLECPCRCS